MTDLPQLPQKGQHFQMDENNGQDLAMALGGTVQQDNNGKVIGLDVPTPHGLHRASPTDHIVRDEAGNHFVLKHEDFEKYYEEYYEEDTDGGS